MIDVSHGRLESHLGNYDVYLERIERAEASSATSANRGSGRTASAMTVGTGVPDGPSDERPDKLDRQRERERRKARERDARRLEKLEARIAEEEARIESLKQSFAEPDGLPGPRAPARPPGRAGSLQVGARRALPANGRPSSEGLAESSIDGARPGEGEGDASAVAVDVGEAHANPAADLDAATASSLLEKFPLLVELPAAVEASEGHQPARRRPRQADEQTVLTDPSDLRLEGLPFAAREQRAAGESRRFPFGLDGHPLAAREPDGEALEARSTAGRGHFRSRRFGLLSLLSTLPTPDCLRARWTARSA